MIVADSTKVSNSIMEYSILHLIGLHLNHGIETVPRFVPGVGHIERVSVQREIKV